MQELYRFCPGTAPLCALELYRFSAGTVPLQYRSYGNKLLQNR